MVVLSGSQERNLTGGTMNDYPDCSAQPNTDERCEPTDEDLAAIAGWTWAGYQRMYQDHLCAVASQEERWGNWKAGLGYTLDAHALHGADGG
jgi:hypothetical protein